MKCLCASTRNASRLLTRFYEEELRPTNITPAQFEVLGTLAARPDLSQAALAASLHLDQTTLSRNLKLLIERRWVKQGRSKQDSRQAVYRLSTLGQESWQQALPSWQHAQSVMQQKLGSDWELVFAALEKIGSAC